MKNLIFTAFAIVLTLTLEAQNTVGLLSYDDDQTYAGYTLIFPHRQPNVYLLDNCGEVVHTWEDEAEFVPGNVAYLRADGSIVKTKRNASVAGDNIWAGGGGAFVEIRSWDNELLWEFEMNNDSMRIHHDIEVMPNGNILMVAWELKTNEEARAQGRDSSLLNQEVLWPDMVFEINPETNEIVWEWHAWDHLIQDRDPSKPNFGVISEHKELIDVNYDTSNGASDWMHVNAIDYNADLDQIMISVPTFSELWIIDHSTTTAQAAGHFGGTSNHGGDLIYRAGNPQTYAKGDSSDQLFFYQHDTHWGNEFLPPNHPHKNNLIVFNNRLPNYSAVEILESVWEMYISDYESFDGAFPPFELESTITHPDTFSVYSTGLSSAQLLPNGNTLICSGRQGYIFELNADNEVVWEYITPINGGAAATQGDSLELNDNLTFRAFKYPADFEAFEGRDLSPKYWIEANPDETFCDELTFTNDEPQVEVNLYPNPASRMAHLKWSTGGIVDIKVYDNRGLTRITTKGNGGMKYLDVSNLESGVYYIRVAESGVTKMVIR